MVARDFVAELAALWEAPGLEQQVAVKPSARMTRMLGCYDLRRREIRIAAWLLHLQGPPPGPDLESLRREVLCHEAAHALVHQRHGRVSRPHGREWRELMQQAGYPGRVKILGVDGSMVARHGGRAFEHRCPVCERGVILGSRQPRRRCRACLESRRHGRLVIRQLAYGLAPGSALGLPDQELAAIGAGGISQATGRSGE